jgi:putative DNA primase/helicase
VSGVDALVVDGGRDTLFDLEQQHGELPPTNTACAQDSGSYLLFRHANGIENLIGPLGPGLGLETDGGYVVAPSIGRNGPWAWAEGAAPEELEPAAWPDWLLLLARSTNGVSNGSGHVPAVDEDARSKPSTLPLDSSSIPDELCQVNAEPQLSHAILDAALRYARLGWPVMPLAGKKPIISDWPNAASTDEAVIRAWWRKTPTANVGILMGERSGVFAVDVDPRHGGEESLGEMVAKHGPLPNTLQQLTPTRGRHILFQHPGFEVPTLSGLLPGIDIRGDHNGQIVAEPSIHPDVGGTYAWDGLAEIENQPIAAAPVWLLELLRAKRKKKGSAAALIPEIIPHGTQHETLVSIAGTMRNRGLESPEILAALLVTNQTRCEKPGPEENIREIAESVGKYPPRQRKNRATALVNGATANALGQESANSGASVSTDEADASDGADEDAEKDTNVDELARAILAEHYFARDAGGRLYVFAEGVYKPTGEMVVRQRVKSLLNQWDLACKWSSRRALEVVEYIRVDRPELWSVPPADVLNVQNGLLDVRTREMKPHSPEFLSAIQLPVTFDPEARCPAWEQFVSEVFPEDSEAIAWEIPAWLMTPVNDIQKAVLLLGEGSNGKSTYLRGCMAFVGRKNTAALSLHRLEQDKFSVARLVGKLANICPDLPTDHLASTSTFKALTGNDVLPAEYKFKDSFEFVPFCKLIFSANRPPRSDDATHGFFRRWQVVPFSRSFEEGAKETKRPEELDACLADPAELSGVLNKALQALAKLREDGFTQSESMRQAWDEFRNVTDPLAVWLEQFTTRIHTAMVAKSELMAAFNRYLTDAGKPPMTQMAFGLTLKRACPSITEAQRTWRGRPKTWVYSGIGFASPVQNDD